MTFYKKNEGNLHNLAFIAPSADIIGKVSIGKYSSVWYGCVLRGDVSYITVGENTNIQDGTIRNDIFIVPPIFFFSYFCIANIN